MKHEAIRKGTRPWAILRMSGPRTLKVVDALNAAGLEAWTPTRRALKRKHRSTKQKVPFSAPITPTLAFVRAEHLDVMRAAMALPINPFPPFSVYQFDGSIPLIADYEINGLRKEEIVSAARFETELRAYETEQEKDKRRAMRKKVDVGCHVDILNPGFLGMHGVVVRSNGKEAWVDVGGNFPLRIDSWLLVENELGTMPA